MSTFFVPDLSVLKQNEKMATVKIHLDQRRVRKDGTFPLVIRVRIVQQYFDILTAINLKSTDFDSRKEYIKGQPKLSSELQIRKNQTAVQLHSLISSGKTFSEVKIIMLNRSDKTTVLTIENFWLEEISRLSSVGRAGGARVYLSSFKGIKNVINLNIPFKELKFKDLIKAEEQLRKRNVSFNSISVYMRTLRAICNKAINLELVDASWYPFKKYKIKKEKTVPRTLSIEEMRKFFSADISPTHKWFKSYCIGMLIFQLRGINLRDLLMLTDSNIINNRVVYKRSKTGKLYSVKILTESEQILRNFTGKATLLGILDDDIKNINHDVNSVIRYVQHTKNINSHLRKLGKTLNLSTELSTYVFRYSYANIAKQLGYSKDMIAEALGHEYGNSVTGIYLELFDQEKIDEMNDSIQKYILREV